MELLASEIHNKNISFPDGEITNELEVFEYQYTATGVRYNAPAGYHDDCVNALALAWSMYVQEQPTNVKYSFL